MTRLATCLIAVGLASFVPSEALALIRGDVGNKPVSDPGWPAGASAIFNHPGRVAWWEGPPFGGGQWHAECRGDARAFNLVLADFAKLDARVKRVVVHDGVGRSFWLAPNREPDKREAARVDWIFMTWQPSSWEHLRNLPADLNPTEPGSTSPPAQVDVYTASLDWAAVQVPAGIEVDDQRLVAHGFANLDGVVLEGRVTDLTTARPLGASVQLQRVEPQQAGGYQYPVIAKADADAQGRWVLKRVPPGWYRVVLEANNYAPRVVGYDQLDDQPGWHPFNSGLVPRAEVSGRVIDQDGKPLAGVDVQLRDLTPKVGGRYESPDDRTIQTDAQGRFQVNHLPSGQATVWVHKEGYCRPGLGLPIETPRRDVELAMTQSSRVRVSVDFAGQARPADYIIKIRPEAGEAIGTYGGSGSIDAAGQMTFENVPPGRYVIRGQPNPTSGDQQTDTVTVELKGGQKTELTLKPKP